MNTYTTASAAATSAAESASMSASNGAVDVPTASSARALTWVSVDARPGVSTTVSSRSFSLVSVTSTYATRAAGTPRRCGIMPSSSSGRLRRVPSRQTTSTRSAGPYRNRVTTRVHSPTAVGRHPAADQGVDECRLSGFQATGDRHPQRLIETIADLSYLVTGLRADPRDDLVTQRRHAGG